MEVNGGWSDYHTHITSIYYFYNVATNHKEFLMNIISGPFWEHYFHKYNIVCSQRTVYGSVTTHFELHLEKVSCKCTRSMTCFQSSCCHWLMPALDGVGMGTHGSLSSARTGVAWVCKVKAAGWNLQLASTCSIKTREETIGRLKAVGPRVLVCPGGDIGSSERPD